MATTNIPILHGTWLCEPVIWCAWNHRGDLTTTQCSTTMELRFADLTEMLRRYPAVKALGFEHSEVMVDCLNREHGCDLWDSVACLKRVKTGRAGSQSVLSNLVLMFA